MRVAMIAAEAAPFSKTGGLGDVLGSLPQALEEAGVRVTLVLPAHRGWAQASVPVEATGVFIQASVSGRAERAELLRARVGEAVDVCLIKADKYFDRDEVYGHYQDNAERFVFFCRAALEVLRREPPDIIHAHDWPAALAIAFLKTQPERYPELVHCGTVFTVHNLGYQGQFWHYDWHLLEMDWTYFTVQYLEFYGHINFLKGGVVLADAVTTVSPTYAEEIKTPAQGFGLDGVFRDRAAALHGILNGADYRVWNPETDPHIAARYSFREMLGKEKCKADLQRVFGLPERQGVPLFGIVSRLAGQKGFDLLESVVADFLNEDVQLVLVGTGEPSYELFFRRLQDRYPKQVAVRIAFDEALAHKVEAGADMFLMPSRYEPGGLNQIYSLRYGTIPIVRATGGLQDTVSEFDPVLGSGTGFLFGPSTPEALWGTIQRALGHFLDRPNWQKLMRNAMASDFSWERSARAYAHLYASLMHHYAGNSA